MKQKRDYDESLVTVIPRAEAELIFPDVVATFDNTEAFKDQVKADPKHEAWKLDEKVDEDD